MRSIRTLLVMAPALLIAACLPQLDEPEVRVESVRLGGIGFRGGVLHVNLHVVNPNRFDLEADGLSYDIDFAEPGEPDRWIDFTAGEFTEDIRVPARDSVRVSIPVEFGYDAVGSALRSVLDRGTLDYRISGRVQLQEPLRREIPFRKSGQVALLGG